MRKIKKGNSFTAAAVTIAHKKITKRSQATPSHAKRDEKFHV